MPPPPWRHPPPGRRRRAATDSTGRGEEGWAGASLGGIPCWGDGGAGTTVPPPSCVTEASDLGNRARLGERGDYAKAAPPSTDGVGALGMGTPRHPACPTPRQHRPVRARRGGTRGPWVTITRAAPPLAAHGVSTITISPRLRSPTARAPWVALLLLAVFAIASPRGAANEFDLPVLGDATSRVISLQQEYDLGRAWLRAFRARVQTLDDPQLQFYLEQLLQDLAAYSSLENPRLELVVINNPTMNAFAVPGGVVGAHTGLFRFAESEDQLASVMAHELAHL